MDTETLLRIDPALRVAMAIGHQSGIPSTELQDWYGDLILDEITLSAFFNYIEIRITDGGLLQQFLAVKRSLPFVGSNPTPTAAPVATVVPEERP